MTQITLTVVLSTPGNYYEVEVTVPHDSTIYAILAVACEEHNVTLGDVLGYTITGHTWQAEA